MRFGCETVVMMDDWLFFRCLRRLVDSNSSGWNFCDERCAVYLFCPIIYKKLYLITCFVCAIINCHVGWNCNYNFFNRRWNVRIYETNVCIIRNEIMHASWIIFCPSCIKLNIFWLVQFDLNILNNGPSRLVVYLLFWTTTLNWKQNILHVTCTSRSQLLHATNLQNNIECPLFWIWTNQTKPHAWIQKL